MDHYVVITTDHDYRAPRAERLTVDPRSEFNAWELAHQSFDKEQSESGEDRTVVAVFEARCASSVANAIAENAFANAHEHPDRNEPEMLESVRGEFDEDGFHLFTDTDFDSYDIRVTDTSVARDLLREVSRLRTWIEDEARERSAYDAASQEERDEVLGRRPGDPDPGEMMRESVDLMRKRERES